MAETALKRPWAGWVLIGLHVLLGISALIPGAFFIVAPDGHLLQMSTGNLGASPFSSFLIPGLLLFFFVGIYPLAVAYSLWKRPDLRWPEMINPFKRMHWSWAASLAAAAILIIWISVQVVLIRTVVFLHYLMWSWGLVLALLTLLPAVRHYYSRPSPA